jgi:hypothetical protein
LTCSIRTRGNDISAAEVEQTPAHASGRRGARGRWLAARDQVRRLPHARSDRRRQGHAADHAKPELVASLPAHDRGFLGECVALASSWRKDGIQGYARAGVKPRGRRHLWRIFRNTRSTVFASRKETPAPICGCSTSRATCRAVAQQRRKPSVGSPSWRAGSVPLSTTLYRGPEFLWRAA